MSFLCYVILLYLLFVYLFIVYLFIVYLFIYCLFIYLLFIYLLFIYLFIVKYLFIYSFYKEYNLSPCLLSPLPIPCGSVYTVESIHRHTATLIEKIKSKIDRTTHLKSTFLSQQEAFQNRAQLTQNEMNDKILFYFNRLTSAEVNRQSFFIFASLRHFFQIPPI